MNAKVNPVEAVFDATTARLKTQGSLELWQSLKSELTREGGGPEAAEKYLEAEVARLSEMIKRNIAIISGKR